MLYVDGGEVALEVRTESGAVFEFTTTHLVALATRWANEVDAGLSAKTRSQHAGQRVKMPMPAPSPVIKTRRKRIVTRDAHGRIAAVVDA